MNYDEQGETPIHTIVTFGVVLISLVIICVLAFIKKRIDTE
jgi:cbb3-type cytochrome oxidase subunit 3